jgi:hypothetical protein
LLTYLPGSSVKEPSALSLFKEKCSSPGAYFIHLPKSLVDEPTSRFLSGAPMERVAHLQSLFYLSSKVSSKGAIPPGSLHTVPIETNAPPPEALSAISQSPWKRSPLQVAQLTPVNRDACPQSLPFIIKDTQ